MATYTCSIGGSTRDVIVDGFSIQETADGVDTLSCDVRSLDRFYRPAVDDDFLFIEDGTTRFGGKVESVTERGAADHGGDTAIILSLEVKSYSKFAERRFLTITLAAGTLKAQLTQLNTAAFAVFGTAIHASQADGPDMPELPFTDDVQGNDILDVIVKTAASIANVGHTWKIDENNKLRVTYTGEVVAPFDVTDSDSNAVGDVTVETTRNDLFANILKISVDSGPATSSESFVLADGVSAGGFTTFTAQFPASQSVNDLWPNELTFDGANQGPIAFGTDALVSNGGTFAWAWNYTASPATLVFDEASTGSLPTTETIDIEYAIRYPITKTVTDATSVAAIGPWERKVSPPSPLGDEALQAWADGVFASQKPVKQEIHYDTRQTGIKPGMQQTITISKRSLSADVLVQEVDTKAITTTDVVRSVSAVMSDAFQGTFRGTLEQWMKGTSGGSAPVVTGVAAATSGLLKFVSVSIGDTAFKASADGLVTILPAFATPKRAKPIAGTIRVNTATAYTNVDADARLELVANGKVLATVLINDSGASVTDLSDLIGDAVDKSVDFPVPQMRVSGTGVLGPALAGMADTTDLVAQAISLRVDNGGSGAFTGGDAANAITVDLWYVEESLTVTAPTTSCTTDLFSDDFESGTLAGKYDSVADMVQSAGIGTSGSAGMEGTGTDSAKYYAEVHKTISPAPSARNGCISMDIKPNAAIDQGGQYYIEVHGGTADVTGVGLYSGGSASGYGTSFGDITVYDATFASLQDVTGALTDGVYTNVRLEFELCSVVAGVVQSDGWVKLYLDDVLTVDLSGLSTLDAYNAVNNPNNYWDTVRLAPQGAGDNVVIRK